MECKYFSKTVLVSHLFISLNWAFDNELVIKASILPIAEANFLNVGRLDESILFSTNNVYGANITIKDIQGGTSARLIANGALMLLPTSYSIFRKPLIIETPLQPDQKNKATLGIDISIN